MADFVSIGFLKWWVRWIYSRGKTYHEIGFFRGRPKLDHNSKYRKAVPDLNLNRSWNLIILSDSARLLDYAQCPYFIGQNGIPNTSNLVADLPVFIMPPENEERLVDQKVVLCCVAEGEQPPTRYVWYKDNSLLDPRIYHYSLDNPR